MIFKFLTVMVYVQGKLPPVTEREREAAFLFFYFVCGNGKREERS